MNKCAILCTLPHDYAYIFPSSPLSNFTRQRVCRMVRVLFFLSVYPVPFLFSFFLSLFRLLEFSARFSTFLRIKRRSSLACSELFLLLFICCVFGDKVLQRYFAESRTLL